MPRTQAELPRRSICKYPDHQGPRWILWVYFGTKWCFDKKTGYHYIYLIPYCKTCVAYQSRKRAGITGKKNVKLYTAEERSKRRRERNNASFRRKMQNKKARDLLNEQRRMRRKIKNQLNEQPPSLRQLQAEQILRTAVERYRNASKPRREARGLRDRAIKLAVRHGLPTAEIASICGLSARRVQEIVKPPAPSDAG